MSANGDGLLGHGRASSWERAVKPKDKRNHDNHTRKKSTRVVVRASCDNVTLVVGVASSCAVDGGGVAWRLLIMPSLRTKGKGNSDPCDSPE